MKKVRVNLLIDEDLKKKVGVRAVLENKRLSAMVEEILRRGLEEIEKEEKKKSGV
ncbi:MAG: hypothetical protein QW575_08045 [Thermoproteota archaeon]